MSRDGWCRAHARTAAGAPGCAEMPGHHHTHLQPHIGTPPPGPAGRCPAKVARAAEDPTDATKPKALASVPSCSPRPPATARALWDHSPARIGIGRKREYRELPK